MDLGREYGRGGGHWYVIREERPGQRYWRYRWFALHPNHLPASGTSDFLWVARLRAKLALRRMGGAK